MLANPSNNSTIKICLFGTVKLTRSTIKRNFIYNVYVIAFGGAGSWSFSDEVTRYIVNFDVDNILSRYSENQKNKLLILNEGPTDDTNESVGQLKVSSVFTLPIQKQNFVWSYVTKAMKVI